ncbi:LytR/AlgR family response regulator transcription factor [Lysinibacillus sp. NPDC093688]|uniref:LytR/AlgR family response regulator transcription factor n=1 Tax=Lysinibacillus sp. NPDC093688 TaxID=3390577 RepID=UPI003D03039C
MAILLINCSLKNKVTEEGTYDGAIFVYVRARRANHCVCLFNVKMAALSGSVIPGSRGSERVQSAVEKLMAKRRATQANTMEKLKDLQLDKLDKLTVYVNDRILLIKIQEILYCTSEDSKTIVVTENGSYFASESLAALENKLTLKGFVRVHRAFIVNLEHIEELEPWSSSKYNLILHNRHSIPVSRLYMKDVRKIFQLSK